MSVRARVVGAVALALAAAMGPAVPAAASQGSVPLEVATFVAAPDGLIAELDEFLGVDANGEGIDFDDTTELGAIDRVFTFSPAWLAGEKTDAPASLANEWTVPVTVGGQAVGVAVVWINPSTVRPQLADFVADGTFATKLADVPAEAYLVNDVDRAAWFVLEQPRLLVLVSGTSGVTSETSLDLYQEGLATETGAAAETAGPGSLLPVAIIGGAVVIVIGVLAGLKLRSIRRSPSLAEAKDRR